MRFIDRCRADLATLDARDLPAAEVQMVAHRIAGLAGTFGLHELGAAAGALDQRIDQALPYSAEFDKLRLQLSLV